MSTIAVNPPKTPVTKGSSGIAAATLPNVCKMPGPPAPFVPTPLPNIGKSGDSPQGYSQTVKFDRQPVAITGASFGSQGDMASKGTGGGLVSNNTHGPTKFLGPGSMNVQVEGKNVQLLSDPMLNNCGPSGSPANAATMTGIIQNNNLVMVTYGDDKPCERCGKLHPLNAGDETLQTIRALFKALRRAFDAQKEQILELNQLNVKLREKDRRRIELKRRQRSLGAIEQAELQQLAAEIPTLDAHLEGLVTSLKASAVLRWERDKGTFSKGYMVGVMVCLCKGKKLVACSGPAPPAFRSTVSSAGFECASPPVSDETKGTQDPWQCAAKQIMDKLGGHRPEQLIERWFSPFVKGLKPLKEPKPDEKPYAGPNITYDALIEDPQTKNLVVKKISNDKWKTGQNVPSCSKCQEKLAALYCDTQCG